MTTAPAGSISRAPARIAELGLAPPGAPARLELTNAILKRKPPFTYVRCSAARQADVGRKMLLPSKTALFIAAKTWDAVSVERMMAASPDLADATDAKGRTALHMACTVKPGGAGLREPNGIRTAVVLLDAGAELDAQMPADEHDGDFRATPLWFAVARGENLPLVEFLLARGADPSYPLWAVVWRDDEVFCRKLLNRKPRLDLIAEGETPIFYAARLRRLKTLRLLIQAGADPTITDDRGRNAVDIARARRLPPGILDSLADAQRTVEKRRV